MIKKRISGLGMHCHHDVLFEWVWDFDERVADIRANKPKEEQELRLRLFKMVPVKLTPGRRSKLWVALNKAWAAYNKARVAHNKALAACNKAWAAQDKAEAAYDKAQVACDKALAACSKAKVACDKAWDAYNEEYVKELDALHEKLCPDCPWDGETIFPGPPN